MAEQLNSTPTRKVMAGGLSGAVTVVLVWLLNAYILPAAKPIPAEISSALPVIVTFLVSYMVSPSAADQVKPT